MENIRTVFNAPKEDAGAKTIVVPPQFSSGLSQQQQQQQQFLLQQQMLFFLQQQQQQQQQQQISLLPAPTGQQRQLKQQTPAAPKNELKEGKDPAECAVRVPSSSSSTSCPSPPLPTPPSAEQRAAQAAADDALTTVVFQNIPLERATAIAVYKELQRFEGVANWECSGTGEHLRVFVQFHTHALARRVVDSAALLFGDRRVAVRWVDRWSAERPTKWDHRAAPPPAPAPAPAPAPRPRAPAPVPPPVRRAPTAEELENVRKIKTVLDHIQKSMAQLGSAPAGDDAALTARLDKLERLVAVVEKGLFCTRPAASATPAATPAARIAELRARRAVIANHYTAFAKDPAGFLQRHARAAPRPKPPAPDAPQPQPQAHAPPAVPPQ